MSSVGSDWTSLKWLKSVPVTPSRMHFVFKQIVFHFFPKLLLDANLTFNKAAHLSKFNPTHVCCTALSLNVQRLLFASSEQRLMRVPKKRTLVQVSRAICSLQSFQIRSFETQSLDSRHLNLVRFEIRTFQFGNLNRALVKKLWWTV